MILFPSDGIRQLIDTVQKRGYRIIGPVRQGETISLGEISGPEDLPRGYSDEQAPGRYTLHSNSHSYLFGHAVGALNWKRFLFPPEHSLVRFHRTANGAGWTPDEETPSPDEKPLAFLCVRPCDLAALATLDRVFLSGTVQDPLYERRRRSLLVIAVNCTHPSATCFCGSMGTGPEARSGYDIVLTELTQRADHPFVVSHATEKGMEIMKNLSGAQATTDDVNALKATLVESASRLRRSLDTQDLESILASSYDLPVWEAVAQRCLSCANCTLVCPTCFCSTVDDVTDLSGSTAERTRRWDSCFTLEYSYIHGGSVRQSVSSRYRQWLTHKFGTWNRQFGMSGCVGCGRCITWCPAAIDVTQELAEVRRQIGGRNANHKELIHGNP